MQQKLKTDTYEDIEELSADIELLVNNAKAFYKPDTIEYRDAVDLWKLYMQTKLALENGERIILQCLLLGRIIRSSCVRVRDEWCNTEKKNRVRNK